MTATAALVMWNDVQPDVEEEYRRWHTAVHVPERLANPGFRHARRYWNPAATTDRYFTMYAVDGLDVLQSEPYRHLLEHPVGDTDRIMSAFRNFTRGACELAYSASTAIGGTVATWRFDCDPATADDLDADLHALAATLPDGAATVGAHAGIAINQAAAGQTREGMIRARVAPDKSFTAVVIAECITPQAAESLDTRVRRALDEWNRPVSGLRSGVYSLATWIPGRELASVRANVFAA